MGMTGSTPQVKTAYLLRIALTRVLPVIIIVIFVLVISGYSYLASPLGAARISSILATSLQLPVRISRINLNGDTLVLKGVELGNPRGFPEKHLLFVESLSLAPGWKGLLSGRATLR